MLLSHLKIQFIDRLKDEYPATEIESFFHILAEEYLGMRRIDIALKPGYEISEEQKAIFEKAVLRLQNHEPIQYITGTTEFCGMEFKVDKNVLIPRPETEELVHWIIADHKDSALRLKILDIGSGSGCIPVCLAKELENSKLTSYDISEKALALAKENADLHKVNVSFKKVDILNRLALNEKFDIIVSNPPYVRELEKKEMHRNVLEHEPELALYVANENALVFYEKITELAAGSLNENGCLYFEINQYLAHETKDLVESYGFEARLKKDIFGNYRMLKAIRKIAND